MERPRTYIETMIFDHEERLQEWGVPLGVMKRIRGEVVEPPCYVFKESHYRPEDRHLGTLTPNINVVALIGNDRVENETQAIEFGWPDMDLIENYATDHRASFLILSHIKALAALRAYGTELGKGTDLERLLNLNASRASVDAHFEDYFYHTSKLLGESRLVKLENTPAKVAMIHFLISRVRAETPDISDVDLWEQVAERGAEHGITKGSVRSITAQPGRGRGRPPKAPK